MLTTIFLFSVAVILSGYIFYGGYIEKQLKINFKKKTPAHIQRDDIDFVPAPMPVLFGHHFSSIAGAGPVVGPIIAAMAFGWLPALVWVLLGGIFIGGVHDYSALVASIRHQGRSIAELANKYLDKRIYKLFLLFIWLTLIYVLTVFIDLTSATFVSDGTVASASLQFMVLAVGFGFCLYRLKVPTLWASLIFVPLTFFSVYLGQIFPVHAAFQVLGSYGKFWNMILIVYCYAASILPVWILLQPRDYLSSFLLYASILAGVVGICLGRFAINYPAFTGWTSPEGTMFPFLFVIVACGAISGFHAIVAGGTTSKQIAHKKDAKPIAFGGMLVETLVAVIALGTIMMFTRNDVLTVKQPMVIYGNGIAQFLSLLGIPAQIGYSMGLLALSTFILTTLDTATRLGRYIFEEFFNIKHKAIRYLSTLATLLMPTIFSLMTLKNAQGTPIPVWQAIWPVFGTSNQLLAALTLLVLSVWLSKSKLKNWFTIIPMLFMFVITLWALALLLIKYGISLIGGIAIILFVLALALAAESMAVLKRK
jgi:carbon starvation protein